jgi:hypothetical protein
VTLAAGAARMREAAARPPGLAAAAILAVFLGVAVSVDFPRVSKGFKGDEATYYSLAHSLAGDGDFTFQRQDLLRVREEYSAPEGIFLKRGSDIEGVRWTSSFPFIRLVQSPDEARGRLYYGKSYIYPLFAAPFVRVFGTNGFLVFHALLLTLCFGAAYRFLAARGSPPGYAAAFAAVFLFASVVPIYFVWLMPELFNFSLVLSGYFLWAYKLVARDEPAGAARFERFLRSGASDYGAAILLGLATFSKPTHVLLFLPLLGYALLRLQLKRLLILGTCFAAVVAGLFAINAAVTGEISYQGGHRKSFYSSTGFPFANTWETFDSIGAEVATDAVPFDILLHRDTASVLAWNLVYFVIGRYGGLLPYFFPGLLAAILFLWSRRERAAWQWLVAGGIVFGCVVLLMYMPYTYTGGGGPIGNRYFIAFYALFLFLMPAVRTPTPIVAGLVIGMLFTAKLLLNPFYTSRYPGEHAKTGPLRLLPIELTLLNDLPVSADIDRARRTIGGTPPLTAYFPDDGAFPPEGDGFWVRGESRADVMLRAPAQPQPDGSALPLRVRHLSIEVTNGRVPNDVVVASRWRREAFTLQPGEVRTVDLALGAGVPYKPSRYPTNYVYAFSVSASAGFVPILESPETAADARYLGVRVRLTPVYYNP